MIGFLAVLAVVVAAMCRGGHWELVIAGGTILAVTRMVRR